MNDLPARWDIRKTGTRAVVTYTNCETNTKVQCGTCEYHIELLKAYVAEEGDDGDGVFENGALIGLLTGGKVVGVA